ncbi:MAG: carboxylating nicotinate-nucleotide diphosphorylase [Desulfobacteraceae bacterium]|nr:MAG: carboxylating nicotinate-nucleotide diphosphorylase [Desulfobacteraceae bacterium]
MIEVSLPLERILREALEEDLGTGDLTTDLVVDPGQKGTASVLAKEELVLAGITVFSRTFEILSDQMRFVYSFRDGQKVPEGGEICRVSGPASSIFKGERTALNLLQRMCSIATLTRAFVEKCGSEKTRIVDTRKTAPGLRILDKYAVRMGGGFNHRFGLYDGILLDGNHIAAAGSITEAVRRAKLGGPHTLNVEVEVKDLAGVDEAITAGADGLLLHNMSPSIMRKVVRIAGRRVVLEAAGGVHLGNIREIADTGVDLISVDALTQSPGAVEISLELRLTANPG